MVGGAFCAGLEPLAVGKLRSVSVAMKIARSAYGTVESPLLKEFEPLILK